jgi:hypothetical protein
MYSRSGRCEISNVKFAEDLRSNTTSGLRAPDCKRTKVRLRALSS